MRQQPPSLDDLWQSASPSGRVFRPEQIAEVPASVQRYLTHAIAPDTPLASAVRLRMHGGLKLGRWFPFEAEQVIVWDRGMIWAATVRTFGVPIRGFDRVVDGKGAQRWKLLGLIPVMSASGPDVARSTAGRMAAESMWMPSVLCRNDVTWSVGEEEHPQATVEVQGFPSTLTMTVDDGHLQSTEMVRWGDPGDGTFRAVPFGAVVEAEQTFGGYTIPSRLRVGWYFGTDRFASEGEFFRGVVDEAVYK